MNNQELLKLKEVETIEAAASLKGLKGCRIIASVKSVSRDGMNRSIKFACIKNNGLYYLTYNICKLLDEKITSDDCIRVNGCGMDMIFDTITRINRKIATLDGLKYDFKNECNYIFNANNYTTI